MAVGGSRKAINAGAKVNAGFTGVKSANIYPSSCPFPPQPKKSYKTSSNEDSRTVTNRSIGSSADWLGSGERVDPLFSIAYGRTWCIMSS